MKLMNADKTIQKIMDILDEIKLRPEYKDATDSNGNKIKFGFVTSVHREKEADGNFHIVIELRRDGVREKKVLVIYFVEHLHGITTLMLNGLLHNVVFENSTMNSPDIVLTYLPEAILSDVKILAEKEFTETKKWKERRTGYRARKTGDIRKKSSIDKRRDEKSPYKKSYIRTNEHRKYDRTNTEYKKGDKKTWQKTK